MGEMQRLIPLDIDGEEHTRFRRLLEPSFASKSNTSQIAGLDVEVRRLANSRIHDFIDACEVELYSQFCTPLRTIIFVSMLGLPGVRPPVFPPVQERHRPSARRIAKGRRRTAQ